MGESIFDVDSREQFRRLLDECIGVSVLLSVSGKEGSERLRYSTGVFTKQVLSGHTIWSICKPLPRPELPAMQRDVLHDFSSAFVVLRSMYEAVFYPYYVLCSDDFANARNVVVLVAELHAERERLCLANNMHSSSDKIAEVVNRLTALKSGIMNDVEFNALPQHVQAYVKTDNSVVRRWCTCKVEDMAVAAGFHESKHLQYYKFFSNYAHSDPLAVQQVEAIRSPADADQMASSIPDYATNFLSRALELHRDVCSSEGLPFDISSDAAELIRFWREFNSKAFGDSDFAA